MSRQWWKFHSERTRIKSHLRRLKNVGMVTEKLYRNTLNTLWFRDCIPDIIAPCKGIRIPESGKFLLVEPGIRKIFLCGIWNPGVRSIQPKFRPVRPGKVVHLKRCVFSKLFRLDRTSPSSFGPKFPEILVERIAPLGFEIRNTRSNYCNPESRSSTDKESGIQLWESGLSHWSRTVYGQNHLLKILIQAFRKKKWRNCNLF